MNDWGAKAKLTAVLAENDMVQCAACTAALGRVWVLEGAAARYRVNVEGRGWVTVQPKPKRLLKLSDGYIEVDGAWKPSKNLSSRAAYGRPLVAKGKGMLKRTVGEPGDFTPRQYPAYARCAICDRLNKLDAAVLRVEVARAYPGTD
jgi:hypothetical protein